MQKNYTLNIYYFIDGRVTISSCYPEDHCVSFVQIQQPSPQLAWLKSTAEMIVMNYADLDKEIK